MVVYSNSNQLIYSEFLETIDNEGAVLLIDKLKDWTSFDIVAKLRSLTKVKKIGHAGTLDPLATGLLIVCLGRKATKQITEFQDLTKKYSAEIKLGATTKSYDAEFDEENIMDIGFLNPELIESTVKKYIGEIEQKPPIFSAKKINGKAMYKYARKNQVVEIPVSKVEIYNIEIKKIDLPFISMDIECSKGTYIRSLARDIGNDLTCGGYLYNLRRTSIGDYHVNNAFSIGDFESKIKK